MSAQPKLAPSSYDVRLESLIADCAKLAKDCERVYFHDGGYERAQALFHFAIQMKALRRPQVTEQLEAARMARALAA